MNQPWARTIRRESGLVENICKCGIGHPAAASVHWMKLNGNEVMGVHGCCGCCHDPEWKLADATEGYKIANEIIMEYIRALKARSGAGISPVRETDERAGRI